MNRTMLIAVWAFTLAMLGLALPASAAGPIKVDSVLLTLIEQVEIPAREPGELAAIAVREGQLVKENMVLAQIDDRESQLATRKAQIERDIAAKEAANDVQVRVYQKSLEVAKAELRRAIESIEIHRKSVSETEMDRLRLVSQRAGLEVEQAQHELAKAQLTHRLKDTEVDMAQRGLDRRKVISPIDGMVVQINHRRGEWVEPGKTVLRVVRINRLRAEGLMNARDLRNDLLDRRVALSVTVPGSGESQFSGKIVFVSPEINPVNNQIRIWAEIDNPDLLLRPGLSGSMVIEAVTASKPVANGK